MQTFIFCMFSVTTIIVCSVVIYIYWKAGTITSLELCSFSKGQSEPHVDTVNLCGKEGGEDEPVPGLSLFSQD